MNPDTACSTDQWSILTSAPSTSQLAGVLGGFLITAIALLFDRNSREGVHTLALFSCATLILMLDSFVFSLISGVQVPEDGDRAGICAVAWTQGVAATGMLAAGTTALFGGLAWMLASHVVNKFPDETDDDDQDARAYCFLAVLGSWLTFAAAMSMALVMSETTIDYLDFMYAGKAARWAIGLVIGGTAVVVLVNFRLVAMRTWRLRRSLVNPAESTLLAMRSIRLATVTMLVLAILASAISGSVSRLPEEWLTAPHLSVVIAGIVTGYVLPSVVLTAICYSVPSTG
ncbi:hypothetical protein ACTXG7_12475 [Mycolicibacterium sp. Dal123E01]|uniref:hypothetical protein n=1 Tax=Mycolicibacterium sp. Dal123E01 TaxID=3457578 RepID=UPI00403ED760